MRSKLSLVFLSVFVVASAHAITKRYTRSELENFSAAKLVEIVLELQERLFDGDDHGRNRLQCTTFNPNKGESGKLITKFKNPGYSNDGTLRWPDGSTFLRMNPGYTDHKNMYYPNGKTLVRKNSGYTDDNTVYWPNGTALQVRNPGYTNDGTINHMDGSVWLRRNRGYTDDGERNGLPVEKNQVDKLNVEARITDDNFVTYKVMIDGDGYRITVDVATTSSAPTVSVTECF
jgi:hypothetical protein